MSFFSKFYEQSVDTFNDDDLTIEKVLDNTNCIQECMSMNRRLLSFLTEEEQLTQLLDLVLTPVESLDIPEASDQESDDETPLQQRARRAHFASEILVCDSAELTEAIVSDTKHLDRIFQFLTLDPPLPANATYFTKLFSKCLSSNSTTDALLKYFYQKKDEGQFDILANIFRHISIAEIQTNLHTLLSPREDLDLPSTMPPFIAWAMANGLRQEIRNVIEESLEDDELEEGRKVGVLAISLAAMQIDCSNAPTSQASAAISELQEWITSTLPNEPKDEAFVPSVLDCVIRMSRKDPYSTVVPLAIEVLQRAPYCFLQRAHGETPTLGLQCILNEAPAIRDILTTPRLSPLQLPTYRLDPPLGLIRLKLVDLLHSISDVTLPCVSEWFLQHGLVTLLMELFECYSSNNLLHNAVLGVLSNLLGNDKARECLVSTMNLDDWILRLHSEGKTDPNKAYIGHLYTLASILDRKGGARAEGWNAFVKGDLVSYVKLEIAPLLATESPVEEQLNHALDDLVVWKGLNPVRPFETIDGVDANPVTEPDGDADAPPQNTYDFLLDSCRRTDSPGSGNHTDWESAPLPFDSHFQRISDAEQGKLGATEHELKREEEEQALKRRMEKEEEELKR
eukprot:Sspe_Gene.57765::Locus_31697_Transcript_1_1_Confidence_1.000_Length_1905::g.57765::m.57765